ncbi:hypothetical protein AB6Q56_08850 [Dechloromonas sp. ARDL1]|uniref:hypothetical protein n=1 Tax=Dechloromonas sp. ARDL1 TaxID=3322121 RepID=UPI003DA6DF69
MNQFHADPRAVAAGLMLPQAHPTDEPRFTDAGLFAMVGAFSYNTEIEETRRLHNLSALSRVLSAAKDGGLDDWAEICLLVLFAEGVSPIDSGEKGQLLAVLCRLVSLSVGRGRMLSLVKGSKAH